MELTMNDATFNGTDLVFNSRSGFLFTDFNTKNVRTTFTINTLTTEVGVLAQYLMPNHYTIIRLRPRVEGLLVSVERHVYEDVKVIYQQRVTTFNQASYTNPVIEMINQDELTTIKLNGTVVYKGYIADQEDTKIGMVGVSGMIAKNMNVYGALPVGYTLTKATDGKTYLNGSLMYLEGVGTKLEVARTSLVATKGYSLSFEYIGTGKIKKGTTEISLSSTTLVKKAFPFTENGEAVEIISDGKLAVKSIQIEDGSVATDFIPTYEGQVTRDKSLVSFPTQNNFYESGSLLLKARLEGTQSSTYTLLKTGNITLSLVAKKLRLQIGAAMVETTAVTTLTSFTAKASWSKEGIAVRLEASTNVENSYSGLVTPVVDSSFLLSGDYLFQGWIDQLTIWKQAYTLLKLKTLKAEDEALSKSFESDFNDVISSKEKTFVEATLAPVDGSPILVEDADGAMKKVNFFDFKTGLYRTYNEEEIIYDGISDELIVAYHDLDTENFKVQVLHNEVEVGVLESIEGQQIHIIFTEEEKKRLIGETLVVRYQRNRSYAIDYKRAALDSYRIYLTKHQGKELVVTQEGNRMSKMRLAKEVELNPLQNAQSEGFLYITDKEQQVSGFRAFLSPERLMADGIEGSHLVIEPIDKEGNEVIGASLEVRASMGAIEPIVNRKQAKLRSTSGRYFYTYHAPYIYGNGRKTQQAFITIKDRETGIGTEVEVYLRPTMNIKKLSTKQFNIEAQIVFEYLAKCYGRLDMDDALIAILDINGDNLIDDTEVTSLENNLNADSVKRMAKALLEWEARQ